MLTLEWILKDIPAFKPDINMPAHKNYLGYVNFADSEWATWNDVSQWYYHKFYGQQLIKDEHVVNKAKELISKPDMSETEKIHTIYDYVKKIRYVSIALGDGELRPNTPGSVMKNQYGDCKDKSTLLVMMLKEIGVKAYPVLALTNDRGLIDSQFPAWNFNHMIVKVIGKDGKTHWFDPTATYCPAGELPNSVENINVLVVGDNGTGTIERTSSNKSGLNTREYEVVLELDQQGNGAFTTVIKNKGHFNQSARYRFGETNQDDLKKYAKSLYIDQYPDVEVDSVHFDMTGSNFETITTIKFRTKSVSKKQAGIYFLNHDPHKIFNSMQWLTGEKRDYPLDLNYPYTFKKSITIKFDPKKYKVRETPPGFNKKAGIINYLLVYSSSEPGIIVNKEQWQVTESKVSASSYKELKAMVTEFKVANDLNIALDPL